MPCDDCDLEHCSVRLMMVKVREAVAKILDEYSLEDMRALSQSRQEALMYHI